MRGRKPKPTALRILQGNPGRRPLNALEPVHLPLPLEAPAVLVTGRADVDAEARAEWDRVTPGLVSSGQVTAVDSGTLVGYCVKFGQWHALERDAALEPFVVTSPTGFPMANPAQNMANKAFTLMLKAAGELGITPSSRSRVSRTSAGDAAPVNPLARFLGARK